MTAKAASTVDVPIAMADEDVPERFRTIRRELHSGEAPDRRD